MIEMFKYLTRTLEKKEQKACRRFALFCFIGPVMDVLCYSEIIYIINTVVRSNEVTREIIFFTLFMAGISLLKLFFDLYRYKISSRFVCKNAQKLSMKLYEVLIKEDLDEHNQRTVSQALAAVRSDAESSINIITSCIEVYINIITMAGYGAVLIYVSGGIGVISCILLILSIIGILFFYQKQVKLYGEKYRSYGIKVSAQIAITYGIFKEMKISGRADTLLRRYEETSGKYSQSQREYKYKSNAIGAFMHNSVLTIMFIVLGLFLMVGNNLSYVLGLMVSYITALVRLITMAYSIIHGFNYVEFSRSSYEALREQFSRYEEIKERERQVENIRQKKLCFGRGLSVRNLTFGYDEREPLFQDISVDIPPGATVAITGVSGAGKTTFLDLVTGLRKPDSGNIFYDDYDIVTQTDREGRCSAKIGDIVSYIPQIVYLNGETIRNNVAVFEQEGMIDDKKITEALKCAQIWADVERMPDGIDTLIGENGIAISGGQRQRIALARALYKDFELLIMDEATAALDIETEKAVIDSIRHVKKDKTMLMVTHHMSLANECDMIYKIEDRKMVRVK